MNIYSMDNGYAYGIISPIGSSSTPKSEPVTSGYRSWSLFQHKPNSENSHGDQQHSHTHFSPQHHHHQHLHHHHDEHEENQIKTFFNHLFHYTEWKKQQEAEKNRFNVKALPPEVRQQLKQLYAY